MARLSFVCNHLQSLGFVALSLSLFQVFILNLDLTREHVRHVLLLMLSYDSRMTAGPLVHYLKTNQKPLGGGPLFSLIQSDGQDGGKRSELFVHKVEKVYLRGEATQRWGSTAYESWIELKTGRTHQVLHLYPSFLVHASLAVILHKEECKSFSDRDQVPNDSLL